MKEQKENILTCFARQTHHIIDAEPVLERRQIIM